MVSHRFNQAKDVRKCAHKSMRKSKITKFIRHLGENNFFFDEVISVPNLGEMIWDYEHKRYFLSYGEIDGIILGVDRDSVSSRDDGLAIIPLEDDSLWRVYSAEEEDESDYLWETSCVREFHACSQDTLVSELSKLEVIAVPTDMAIGNLYFEGLGPNDCEDFSYRAQLDDDNEDGFFCDVDVTWSKDRLEYWIDVDSPATEDSLHGFSSSIYEIFEVAQRFMYECGAIGKGMKKSVRKSKLKKLFFKDEEGANIHFEESFTVKVSGFDRFFYWDYDLGGYLSDCILYGKGDSYVESIDGEPVWDGEELFIWFDTNETNEGDDARDFSSGFNCYTMHISWNEWGGHSIKEIDGITSFSDFVSKFQEWLDRCAMVHPAHIIVDGYDFVNMYGHSAGYELDLGDMSCQVLFGDEGYVDARDTGYFNGYYEYTIVVDSPAGYYEMKGAGEDLVDICKEALLFCKDCGVIEKSLRKSAKKSKSFNDMVKSRRCAVKKSVQSEVAEELVGYFGSLSDRGRGWVDDNAYMLSDFMSDNRIYGVVTWCQNAVDELYDEGYDSDAEIFDEIDSIVQSHSESELSDILDIFRYAESWYDIYCRLQDVE